MKDNKVRLQKFLSESGICSRRKAEEYIENGKVKVNGRIALIGDKVDPYRDKVLFMGKRVVPDNKKMYVMLHKPRGFVTTLSDEMGRKNVSELVLDAGMRLFPVGRLDKQSEGLLLMTNDGDFSNKLTHPSRHVAKVYRVTVREKVSADIIDKLSCGVVIDGEMTAPCEVNVIDKFDNCTVLNFVLYEGKNREIRKMCETVGLTVIRLKRTEIAGVKLGMLPSGKWRELSDKELQRLMNVSVAKRDNKND